MSDTSEPRLYTDVAPEEIEQDKRKILKQLATTGRRSLKDIEAADIDADKRLYDLYDEDLAQGTPAMVAAELDRQRSSILAGHDTARGMLGAAHNEELDRIAAATGAYKDKMAAAVPALDTYLQAQIAAIKQAAEDRRRGSGGGPRPLTALEELQLKMMQHQYDQMLADEEDAAGDPTKSTRRNPVEEMASRGVSDFDIGRIGTTVSKFSSFMPAAEEVYVTTLMSDPRATPAMADQALSAFFRDKGATPAQIVDLTTHVRAQLGYFTGTSDIQRIQTEQAEPLRQRMIAPIVEMYNKMFSDWEPLPSAVPWQERMIELQPDRRPRSGADSLPGIAALLAARESGS